MHTHTNFCPLKMKTDSYICNAQTVNPEAWEWEVQILVQTAAKSYSKCPFERANPLWSAFCSIQALTYWMKQNHIAGEFFFTYSNSNTNLLTKALKSMSRRTFKPITGYLIVWSSWHTRLSFLNTLNGLYNSRIMYLSLASVYLCPIPLEYIMLLLDTCVCGCIHSQPYSSLLTVLFICNYFSPTVLLQHISEFLLMVIYFTFCLSL